MSLGKTMNYIRSVLAALRKADVDFSLIDDGDRILVGLSGGKDSLALLRALSVYPKFAKKNFEILPVYLDLGFGNSDLGPLKDYCASLGHPLYVNDSRFVYEILKAHGKPGGHISCSICSRMKKAAMNAIAKEKGFNKVAFAHHSDDAVETLFMNMIHGARVATFVPKMKLERAGVTFIRPLIYCHESDLSSLAREENLPVLESKCPANGFTEREWTKDLLKDIYKTHPEAKKNFAKMLTNYEPFTLFFDTLEFESSINHSYALKPSLTSEDARGCHFATKKKREGEKDFLILFHHAKVGEISYRMANDHRMEIFNVAGPKEARIIGIKELVERKKEEISPLYIVLLGESKEVAEECGFLKKEEPGIKGSHYLIYSKL